MSTCYSDSNKDHRKTYTLKPLSFESFMIVYSQQECQLTQYNELLNHYHPENFTISTGDNYNTSISQCFEDSEKVCYD